MKLAPLLARYLYTHNRMELPGLGIFKLDPQLNSNEKTETLEGVTFENDPSIRDSPGLIQFISTEAGKMKALAAADLDSHLEIAHQFLNIGKPFMFDGIGSLTKQRTGQYTFTAGPAIPEIIQKKESPHPQEQEQHHGTDYKKIFYGKRVKSSGFGALTLVLALAGVILAVWGGYTVYKRNSKDKSADLKVLYEEPVANEVMFTSKTEPAPVENPVQQANTIPGGAETRKFVLETATSKRAFARYHRLKSFQWNVEMETNDSVLYKLYVKIPAAAVDTTRILDSLTRMNGLRVHIE